MSAKQSRRGFLLNVTKYGLPIGLGGGWLLDKSLDALIHRVVDISIPEPKHLPNAVVSSAKTLFFDSGANYKVIPALSNPYKIHGFKAPITSACSDALAHLNRLLDVPNVRTVRTDRLTTHDLSGNLLILGSPVANAVTGAIMGRQGVSPLFDGAVENVSLQFPFYVDLDASENDYASGGHRFRANFGAAPIWRLKGPGRALMSPALKNGQILEDRILITSIPNFLNRTSFDLGHRILILAGAHGAGTRAIGLLVNNEKIVRDLSALSKGQKAWQAIIIVDRISDDGRIPLSLGGIEASRSFEMDFDRMSTISAQITRA